MKLSDKTLISINEKIILSIPFLKNFGFVIIDS